MHHYRIRVPLLFLSLWVMRAAAQDKAAAPSIRVSGEVTPPLTLHATDLATMPRTAATLQDHEGRAHTYTGVPIQHILERAGVTTGKQLRGKHLTRYLLVKCADGYEVLFSLAELDSSFTNRSVILADEMDGQPLPLSRGPFRLVVPGEKKLARSCFQVTGLVIGLAKEE